MIVFILLALIVIVVSIYLFLTWNFNYWKRRGVAGPTPQIYVGTFPKSALFDRDSSYAQETMEIYRKYYREHRFIGVFEYRTPKLLVLDPELVSDIYTTYFRNFGDNTPSDMITWEADPLLKFNPFIDKLALWKGRRMELAPAFTMLKTKAMYPSIENACRQLEQYIGSKIDSGKTILSCHDICARVLADVNCSVIFGLDSRTFDEKSDFLEHSNGMLEAERYGFIRFTIHTLFPWPWLKKYYPNQFTSTKFTKWFKNMMDHAIQSRKEHNIYRDDYLQFLIELQNKKNISMDQIYSHAYTFFLDGFETSAGMLGNALNYLAEHKGCQEKLRAEIKSNGHATFEELHQMPYMDAVFNETIRISPSPFPIWKNCTESVDLTDFDGKTVRIEKGVRIILPTMSLHRHPDFYENPDKFDPERFDESTGGVKRFKDAGVFVPFGNGPRQCLGMRFAAAQIKAVLYTLVGKFEFSIQPSKHENPSNSSTGTLFASASGNSVEFKINRLLK